MENTPNVPRDENLPEGKIRDMEDDIRASMPQVELREGNETLTPPLPRLDLFSPDESMVPPSPLEHGNSHKKVMLGIVLGILVILVLGGGGFYVWRMGGGTEVVLEGEESILEESLETETPLPTEVPEASPEETIIRTPSQAPLFSDTGILKNISARTLIVSRTTQDAILEALYGLGGIPESGVVLLSFEHEIGTPLLTSLGEFSEIFSLNIPAALLDEVTGWQLYVYNSGVQERTFCANIKNSDCAGLRLGLVLTVRSGKASMARMREFETTAKTSLASLIIPATNKSSYAAFRDAEYAGIRLRYFNFPIAPQTQASSIASLNYATIARGGKEYLVLGTSRLALYAMIDRMVARSN